MPGTNANSAQAISDTSAVRTIRFTHTPLSRDNRSTGKATCRKVTLIFVGDPLVCAGFEQIEGKGSAVEHLVVEFADVKLGAQFLSGRARGVRGT